MKLASPSCPSSEKKAKLCATDPLGEGSCDPFTVNVTNCGFCSHCCHSSEMFPVASTIGPIGKRSVFGAVNLPPMKRSGLPRSLLDKPDL